MDTNDIFTKLHFKPFLQDNNLGTFEMDIWVSLNFVAHGQWSTQISQYKLIFFRDLATFSSTLTHRFDNGTVTAGTLAIEAFETEVPKKDNLKICVDGQEVTV